MNTLEFLRRVLPSDGYYCAGFIKPNGGYAQKFVSTIEDLKDVTLAVSEMGADTYYAISSYKNNTNRKQDNVYLTKVFALDIDVGKEQNSYASIKDALLGLSSFISATKLPKPLIVSSGKGLHVYWTLTNPIAPDAWRPTAERLKALALSHGLIIDPAVPTDLARILRPIGTTHVATGRKVRVVMDGPETTIDDFNKVLGVTKRKTTLLNNLEVKREYPLGVTRSIEDRCEQIKWAKANQAGVSEPMWYGLMGVAAYTATPLETATAWSKDHPEFSERATQKKMDQWKENVSGPTTCAKLEELNPSGCKGCKFQGKVSTPVQLGVVYEEIEAAEDAPATAVTLLPLPKPFKRTADGIKLTIDGIDVDVCAFDIYPVSYGKDESLGYETVRYCWNRPHVGWSNLTFRQSYLTDGSREFPTAIADQGIVLPTKKHTETFQYMLRSYMDKLRHIKSLTNLYSTMGWKEDHTQFVVGDTIIRTENNAVVEEQTFLAAAAKNGSNMYGTAGSLSVWSEGTRVLEKANMPWHMFALGMGFAAPLFSFTGLKGLTVSLYGPTGGGKSLAQYWIQSIYGDPDRLHFAAKYTQNALFSRLGLFNNLPLTVDEATMLQDKDIGDFLYWVSQGRDKARLSRSADEREAKTWATPVIVSTNVSLAAKLVSSGLDTNAQMARLLEISVPSHNLFSRDSTAGQKIYSHLMLNYGHAGREFIKELVRMGEGGIRLAIEEARQEMMTKYGASFSGEERYWEQAVLLQDLGSKIAHRLGTIKYDYAVGTRWVLEQLGAIRKAVLDNNVDSFDVLSEYLNEFSSSSIVVMHTGTAKPMADLTRMPRGEIRVRFDLYKDKHGDPFVRGQLLVDRTHFRKWASSKGIDYKRFMAEMRIAGAESTPRSEKASLAKNTPAKLTQSYVIGFDLTHPRLVGVLNDEDGDATRKLTLVTGATNG